jgi:carbamoyl-phosphate synthase large subunit
VPLAKAAARIAVGATIAELRAEGMLPRHGDGGDLPADAPISVKEAVLPFHRFRTPDGRQVDSLLGPEMKSTGEVMGIDATFGTAFAKSQAAAYGNLPTSGTVFVSVANRDKRAAIFPVKRLSDLGFRVLATAGTAQVLRRNGVPARVVGKYSEVSAARSSVLTGTAPDATIPADEDFAQLSIVELIERGEVDLVLNTPFGSPGNSGPRVDGYEIRTAAVTAGIACLTTVQAAAAAVQGIEQLIHGDVGVRSLQDLHRQLAAWREGAGSAGSGSEGAVVASSEGTRP